MIHPATSYILTMPSEQQRLVIFTKGGLTFVGKFGEFQDNQIIGKPFGTYQLENDKIVKINNIEESWFSSTEVDDYHDKLQVLISKNDGFEAKTDYAKDKYVQKHNKKTKNILKVMPITPQALCEYYFKRGPMAILQMNWDVLAIMINMADITHSGKYLCFDSVRGLVVESVYSRIHSGKVYQIMQTDGECNELAAFQKYEDSKYAKSTWSKTFVQPELWVDRFEMNPDLERKKLRMQQRIAIREEIIKGQFNSVILATKFDEIAILKYLLPFMAGCCKVVVYSPYLSKLSKVYEHCRNHPDYCNVDMITTHFRDFQVLPHRTRPIMKSNSSGGGIVTAMRILN
eukprot:NODE_1000_length_2351_cov_0.501332.p1 type:complete len:344 gc:universal NODE_1000_length_2351_cov_0.501332:1518-487(-)